MIEQDYIMRMINVLNTVLANALGLRKKREFPEALQELSNGAKTLLGIDHSLIDLLSPDQLMGLFGVDLEVATPKCYALGIILKEEAAVRLEMGDQQEADRLMVKSLSLLLDTLVAAGRPVEPRHTSSIDELEDGLRGVELPLELLKKSMRGREALKQYARAEDVLFEILEREPEFIGEGLTFYGRLLDRGDAELTEGGLPRGEVLEGRAELEKRKAG